jgi:hypothetical protein
MKEYVKRLNVGIQVKVNDDNSLRNVKKGRKQIVLLVLVDAISHDPETRDSNDGRTKTFQRFTRTL